MSTESAVNPNRVEWSGENPGIYLKETADGPWTALALYFKVVISARGRCTRGDAITSYAETMKGGGKSVELRWSGLGKPYCVEVPPAQSGTGKHQMYSLLTHARSGSIIVDGQALPGKIFDRPFLGGTGRTAVLAFSETWLSPA